MKNNRKWFSLIIAMWLVMITSLLAYTMLEYIIPFSKNVKWIENSTNAFYKANDGIENWLFHISNRSNLTTESGSTFNWPQSTKFETFSSWLTLPPEWKGNSENLDWNKIAPWEPIQLSIWNWMLYWKVWQLRPIFRIPGWLTLSGTTDDLPYINWQLSSQTNSLNANSWSLIKASDIDWNMINPAINIREWFDLNWNDVRFNAFYNNRYCWGTWSGCILKLSIINKLVTTDGKLLPYLERKIDLDDVVIPLRYSRIESAWKSYWFQKKLEAKVPQQTLSEAFDFTVFQ